MINDRDILKCRNNLINLKKDKNNYIIPKNEYFETNPEINKNNEEEKKIKAKKEELKDVKKLEQYLKCNKVNKESFELLNFIDSGSESNVYSIQFNDKNNLDKNFQKRGILKL